jgi:lipid II:glycine glycyltransferase (peptidoglycan interpeptide bridge formation enzyme)
MSVRPATQEELARWDELITASPDGGTIFSSKVYAEQKVEQGGYTAHYLMVNEHPVTVLEKSAPPFGKYWYLPKGPNVATTTQLFAILKTLTPYAKKKGVFVVRIESELDRRHQATILRRGLRPARAIIPNPSTITLDIRADEATLLVSLPQKGRHAIRRAERDGVTTELVKATNDNCKIMYELLRQTAEGQFGIRPYSYYRTFWQRFEKAGYGQLFFAKVNGAVVAGAYAMVLGTKSTYKDGASVRERPAYGSSHLLQWRVIQWAKQRGATLHDFCGSPPSDELQNPDHPHYGIGRFKQSFSRQVVDYIGCDDLVIRPLAYASWLKIGERIYHRLYYRRTRDYYY